jgi:hypothetical protein
LNSVELSDISVCISIRNFYIYYKNIFFYIYSDVEFEQNRQTVM